MVPNRTDDLCEASYLEPQLIDEVGYSMTRYYFDTRDGAEFIRDELGIELDGIEAARDEATRGLADLLGRASRLRSAGACGRVSRRSRPRRSQGRPMV